MVEVTASRVKSNKAKVTSGAKPISLSSVKISKSAKTSTGISEFDRVLGGGLVPGQVVLLAGEPGVGKSTLLLEMSGKIATTLYVAGEESAEQIKIRSDRINSKGEILLLEETNVETIIEVARKLAGRKIKALIVDSIQVITTSSLTGTAGSVGQVRESASRLAWFAKRTGVPVIMVGHSTKQGSIAGPATLAHLVDTVTWFEGDVARNVRLLRATKNRFGPTDEVGIFTMSSKGLVGVDETGGLFVTGTATVPGAVVAPILEGTRPILVEVQALVVPTKMAYPRRVAQGIDPRRLELILATLTQRARLPLHERDVFVNVVGGISVREPGIDLAVSLSCASAFMEKSLPEGTVAVGELGLLGEIREVMGQQRRIADARRKGFDKVISSSSHKFVKEAIIHSLRK